MSSPLIIKPCSGRSSDGVTRIDTISEIPAAVNAINTNTHGNRFLIEPYCVGADKRKLRPSWRWSSLRSIQRFSESRGHQRLLYSVSALLFRLLSNSTLCSPQPFRLRRSISYEILFMLPCFARVFVAGWCTLRGASTTRRSQIRLKTV